MLPSGRNSPLALWLCPSPAAENCELTGNDWGRLTTPAIPVNGASFSWHAVSSDGCQKVTDNQPAGCPGPDRYSLEEAARQIAIDPLLSVVFDWLLCNPAYSAASATSFPGRWIFC